MAIRNLVFDMGDVLIRNGTSYYVNRYADTPEDRKLLMHEVRCSTEWICMDYGSMDEAQAEESCCRRLPERLHEAAHRLIWDWNEEIVLMPGMDELIGRCKAADYRIYLLSNTSRKYHSFRRNIPALRWFDGEFISADWRLLKPDTAIFRAFCLHFGLTPAECLFVDNEAANAFAAKLAGMESVVFFGDAGELEQKMRALGVSPAEA